MKKYSFVLLIPFLLTGCSLFSGKFNITRYRNTDRLIYEEIFRNKTDITDKGNIISILDILATAKKEPVKFIAKEQFQFIIKGDTISVNRNGRSLGDAKGTYSLPDSSSEELDKLLQKILK